MSFETMPSMDSRLRNIRPDHFENIKDFEILYDELRRLGGLYYSDGSLVKADEIIQAIDQVREGTATLDNVTRTGGLRFKVQEILQGKKREEEEYPEPPKVRQARAHAQIEPEPSKKEEDDDYDDMPGHDGHMYMDK